MSSALLDTVRLANREFQEFIEQVSKDGAKVVESRGALRKLQKVDLRLKQIGATLASAAPSFPHQPEAAYQIMKYRENLKTLRNMLEKLQFSLLAEKARIEHLRANIQAACAWASSLRETS